MTQRVILRIASAPCTVVHWMIWDDQSHEIHAHGALNHINDLHLLNEHTATNKVQVMIPGDNVSIIRVTSPLKGHQLAQALPYLCEEELAQDIESVHFSVLEHQKDRLTVCAVDLATVKDWVTQIESHDLFIERMMPDSLCLPLPAEPYQVVVAQLDQAWLLRFDDGVAMQGPAGLLPLVIDDDQSVLSLTEPPAPFLGSWQYQPTEHVMKTLAGGLMAYKKTLLTGELKPKSQFAHLKVWKKVGWAAAVLLAVGISSMALQNWTLQKQIHAVDEQIEQAFRQVVPSGNARAL